jgi:hypothetical protein
MKGQKCGTCAKKKEVIIVLFGQNRDERCDEMQSI